MTEKILLALLIGFVLRFVSTIGVTNCIKKSKSDAALKAMFSFHVFVISYVIGTILKYGGLTFLFAYLIHKYLLS